MRPSDEKNTQRRAELDERLAARTARLDATFDDQSPDQAEDVPAEARSNTK